MKGDVSTKSESLIGPPGLAFNVAFGYVDRRCTNTETQNVHILYARLPRLFIRSAASMRVADDDVNKALKDI